jgi:hypothetical protein
MIERRQIVDLSADDLRRVAEYSRDGDLNPVQVKGELREVHHEMTETRFTLGDTTVTVLEGIREHEWLTLGLPI